MDENPVICMIGATCPPEMEGKFETWLSERHIPDLMKSKKVKKVSRYKLLSATGADRWKITGAARGNPGFLTVYEFKDRKDFEDWDYNPELVPAREESYKVLKELGVEVNWRIQYECVRTWEQ